jgi:hypothetical protein
MSQFSSEDIIHKCMNQVPCYFFVIAHEYSIYHSRGAERKPSSCRGVVAQSEHAHMLYHVSSVLTGAPFMMS